MPTQQDINLYANRQLVAQAKRIYEEPLPPLTALDLFPPVAGDTNGLPYFERRIYKHFGRAEWVGHGANDLPRAGVATIEDIYAVGMFGIAYEYNLKEKRIAQATNTPLDQLKGNAAKRAILEFHADSAFFGSKAKQTPGAFTDPYVPRLVIDADIFRTGVDADLILDTLYSFERTVEELTGETGMPDTLVLPTGIYNYLASTRVSQLGNQTLLSAFSENAQSTTRVVKSRKLTGASPEGNDLIGLFSTTGDKAQYIAPDPLTILAPQLRDLDTIVNMVAETGGWITSFPYEHLIIEVAK